MMLQLRSDERRPTRRRQILRSVLYGLLFGLAALLGAGTAWLQSYFGSIEAEEITFVLATGGGNAAADIRQEVAIHVVLPVLGAVLLGVAVSLWPWDLQWFGRAARPAPTPRVSRTPQASRAPRKPRTLMAARWTRRALAAIAAVVVLNGAHAFTQVVPVQQIVFPAAASSFIEDHYVAPSSENVHFPENKRNLVHILLESYEATYYDAAQGGALPENLLPALGELSDENVSFSHTYRKGGFYQVPGATFTMGGITAQLSGMPLKTPVIDPANQLFTFPDFATVGDLLAEQGYTTEVMMGANADFATKRDYFTQHGNFRIFDLLYARESGYVPADYSVWWGYEDDKLVQFAREELTRLASESAPFYLLLETVDTHAPDGYLSPSVTNRPYAEQFSNVVLHNQAQVTELVRWIQEQPFYENTTIVISGDHLSMDDGYFQRMGIGANYERTVFNTIINPAPGVEPLGGTSDRVATSVDIFPTTLAALGVQIDGERLGLGTNLYSAVPTLAEEEGLESFEENLRPTSDFYLEHLRVAEEGRGEAWRPGAQPRTPS